MKRIKFTWKEASLFVLPLVVLGGVWVQSSRKSQISPVLQKLAGPNAKDCSFSAMPVNEAKWKAMRGCAADSFQAKRPFWVHEDTDANGKGADTGVALEPDGTYYQVSQKRRYWFLPIQTETMRGVGTEIVKNPQTGERLIWNSSGVCVPDVP